MLIEKAATGHLVVIYLQINYVILMSPECAISPSWRNIFQCPYFQQNLVVVAVDEVYCIPEWYE